MNDKLQIEKHNSFRSFTKERLVFVISENHQNNFIRKLSRVRQWISDIVLTFDTLYAVI